MKKKEALTRPLREEYWQLDNSWDPKFFPKEAWALVGKIREGIREGQFTLEDVDIRRMGVRDSLDFLLSRAEMLEAWSQKDTISYEREIEITSMVDAWNHEGQLGLLHGWLHPSFFERDEEELQVMREAAQGMGISFEEFNEWDKQVRRHFHEEEEWREQSGRKFRESEQ